MSTDHTIVTATRALAKAVDAGGRVDARELEFAVQRAVDDVVRKAEAAAGHVDPATLLVDVRVTAFVPAAIR
jgi:hypothetical protein